MLEVDGGAGSVEDLVASSERALLVTCLWYIRKVDSQELLLTGLTRDGTYLVEGGEVVGVVNNFRFNESPISLLGRFSEAGTTGSVVVARMGRLLPAHRDSRRCASPTSTCRASARPAEALEQYGALNLGSDPAPVRLRYVSYGNLSRS